MKISIEFHAASRSGAKHGEPILFEVSDLLFESIIDGNLAVGINFNDTRPE